MFKRRTAERAENAEFFVNSADSAVSAVTRLVFCSNFSKVFPLKPPKPQLARRRGLAGVVEDVQRDTRMRGAEGLVFCRFDLFH